MRSCSRQKRYRGFDKKRWRVGCDGTVGSQIENISWGASASTMLHRYKKTGKGSVQRRTSPLSWCQKQESKNIRCGLQVGPKSLTGESGGKERARVVHEEDEDLRVTRRLGKPTQEK